MPSDNEKGIAFPEKGNKNHQKEHKDKKHGKSIGWIIGVIVLILISVTFILPTTIFSTTSAQTIEFGKYNGEKIELVPSYDNYFYNQLYTLAQTYQMNPQNEMQLYSQAFYATVLETALSQMAAQAGISVTDQMISTAIVKSGTFADENGNFDMEAYNAASAMEKESMKNQLRDMIPAQIVYQDMTSIKTSDSELEFVSALNDAPRSFEYIIIDYDSYPDADAAAYAEADPAPFTTMDLSVITVATEDEANTILASIQNGETTFEEAVAASSTDTYKDENGSMGNVMLNSLQNMLVNDEDAAAVFDTAAGSLTSPVQGYAGWMIFRADSASAPADLTDAEVLSEVKRYISLNDEETMMAYLDAEAQRVYSEAAADFTAAAESNGLPVNEVAASSYNPSYSSFILGLIYNDPEGILASAASADTDYQKTLFTAEENTVLEPVDAGNCYIIARPVAAGTTNDLYASYIDSLYPAYIPEISAQDLQTGIFSSEGFENNFFQVFLERIMGVGAN